MKHFKIYLVCLWRVNNFILYYFSICYFLKMVFSIFSISITSNTIIASAACMGSFINGSFISDSKSATFVKIIPMFWWYTVICHCVKSVPIRSFSGPYFPAFRPSVEKTRTIKTPNTDTFHLVSATTSN